MKKSPEQQLFIARVERFRLNEYVEFEDADNAVLDRICADDPRMLEAWRLLSNMPDDRFDKFMFYLMGAWNSGRKTLAHRKIIGQVREAIGEALEAFQHLHKSVSIMLRHIREQEGGLRLCNSATLLGDCLNEMEADLLRWDVTYSKRWDGMVKSVSRKTKSTDISEFAFMTVEQMTIQFKAPHYEVVASLASVIFDTEISAEQIRKAANRTRARKNASITRRNAARTDDGKPGIKGSTTTVAPDGSETLTIRDKFDLLGSARVRRARLPWSVLSTRESNP